MFQLLEGDLVRGGPPVPAGHLPRGHLHVGGAQVRVRRAIPGVGAHRGMGAGGAQCHPGETRVTRLVGVNNRS